MPMIVRVGGGVDVFDRGKFLIRVPGSKLQLGCAA